MNNESGISITYKNFGVVGKEAIDPEKPAFWIFLTSLVINVAWVTFITLYFSRVIGPVVSFILNRLLRLTKNPGHIKVGSFSISLLGGKIMFKDFVYANNDFSIRINDAWIIFSYWKSVPGKDINYNDQSSRLHISLNGFQLHWYNRVGRYKEIAHLFGMDRFFRREDFKRQQTPSSESPGTLRDRIWALIGIIRLDIWSGRCVVGNELLPYMFVLSWENWQSKIKLFESTNDRDLLSIEGQMESIRANFEKHPDYDGKKYKEYKDPPRTMGDGFAVLQSASLQFFYHEDILDFVKQEKQSIERNNRPVWESILRFGPNTVISFGPWAEQQRALIYKFFFPPDYQTAPVTELPKKGQRRIQIMHDVRISLLKESSIDLWFMRGEQLESIHNRCQAGSTIDMSIWWIINEEGFSWSANVSLLNVVSTTSLLYRKLFECETLCVDSVFQYPREFNGKQVWTFNYLISKATMWFVWDHKRFFTDLTKEWIGEEPADLLEFIPYEVHTNMSVTDGFEIILLLNGGNWVDPSEIPSENENVEAAIVGEKLYFKNIMRFLDFLPETHTMDFKLTGEHEMAMRMKYPPNSAMAPLLAMLTRAAHHNPNASKSHHGTYSNNDNWHECWRTERVVMLFDYKFHPFVPRIDYGLPQHVLDSWIPKRAESPKELPADWLNVFIELEGSEIQLTGLLIRFILDLKNNYFGFYDSMTDIQQVENILDGGKNGLTGGQMFNRVPSGAPVEFYRGMDVDVELRVHNIRAHCLLHSMGGTEPEPCPVLYTEELVMEMKKTYEEMILQVAVGQCAVHFERATPFQPDGFLSLSGVQFRGQALLSPVDVPWDMAVLEYSWQIEVLVGQLTGSLEIPSHFFALFQVIETLLLFSLAKDDETIIPERFAACQHGNLITNCPRIDIANGKHLCEGEDRLKYRQIRVSIDGVQLALCEERSILDLTIDPLRFTVCNAHEMRFTEHLSIRVPSIVIRQLARTEESDGSVQWLEVAQVAVDGISFNIELPLPEDGEHLEKARLEFVKKHDKATRRLYFLYSDSVTKSWECACYGKTKFFGKQDTLGKDFLESKQKFFVPKINEKGAQFGVHQSILRPNEQVLHHEQHYVYTDMRKSSSNDNIPGGANPPLAENPTSTNTDSSSFHSAVSHQREPRPSQSKPLMQSYGTYLTQFDVDKPRAEPPTLGKPGALAEWAKNKVVAVQSNPKKIGMNSLRISHRLDTAGGTFSQEPTTSKLVTNDSKPFNRVEIAGSLADTVHVFLTPLAIEAGERIVNSVATYVHKMNPAFLIQHAYLDCVLKDHRQPLTESLFTSKPRQLKWDVSLDLPKVHCSLFQCGFVDHYNDPIVSTNICFVLVDRARISSALSNKSNRAGRLSLSLHCGVVTSQLLHLVDKSDAEFLPAARTPARFKKDGTGPPSGDFLVNWEQSNIGCRLKEKDLRVIMDVQIPEVNVTYEDQQPILSSTNTTAVTPREPLLVAMAPSALSACWENKVTINIGKIRNLVVMARPLEKTAKNEFPLYDALSPAITAWLNVTQRLDTAIETLNSTRGQWSDMSMARMMKLALECPDEKILGVKGKNKMDTVKLLGRHQLSCPSCLLLKILMRWYALDPHQLNQPLLLHANFEMEKQRKTALMALLSHWHPDICQMVKLASNLEAGRFRADPGEKKKEVRIQMSAGGDATDDEEKAFERSHRRNGSAASRNLTMNGNGGGQRDNHSKLDLYNYIRYAHREWNEKKKVASTLPKDYVNPMDIILQAFFYSLYRYARLNWTNLDSVPLNKLRITYDFNLTEFAVDLLEPKLMTSTSAGTTHKLLTHLCHPLVQVQDIRAGGELSWNIEMDEKNLMPVRGKTHLTYRGSVKQVQFVLAIASVHLVKEVISVAKSASDTLTELKKKSPSQPWTPVDSMTARSQPVDMIWTQSKEPTWDEKVYNMMKDFEKNVQRSGAIKRGDILTAVLGQWQIADVSLQSRLTDLYVSFDMKAIDVAQEHNPIPIGRNLMMPHDTDMLNITLRKAKLNIRQSLSSSDAVAGSGVSPITFSESKPILSCSLQESTVNLSRKHQITPDQLARYDNALSISLGPIEGELPMSAGSLHDVVMKAGPQLEMEFDRLSAQPAGLNWDQGGGGILSIDVPNLQTATAAPVAMGWHRQTMTNQAVQALMRKKQVTPIVKIQFKFKLESIELKAQILPSLLTIYKMRQATSSGETGAKAQGKVQVAHHFAEFHVSPPDKPKDSFKLDLPLIDVNVEYVAEEVEGKEEKVTKETKTKGGETEKVLQYRKGGYLKLEVALGRVNHSFTTELLNHVLFAEQSFRSEFRSLVNRISTSQKAETDARPPQSTPSTAVSNKFPYLFYLVVKGVTRYPPTVVGITSKEPWLQLTAATPTATAVRFTIDELQMELTNRKYRADEGEKWIGRGFIQFAAKLGQLVRPSSYEETPTELQEYATFMTMISVSNEESSSQIHSYNISLNRPYMMIKSSAVDKAILLWLNYKNTYDYWRMERTKYEKSLETREKRHSISQAILSPTPSQDFDINLSLSIVGGMYVCMPLVSHDLTDGMPALVLSLQKSEVSVSIKKELACQAQFHGFRLNFIDNFDEQSLNFVQDAAPAGDVLSNFFFFPQGSYKLCSKASNETGDARWILSVRSHMRGMVIDLDQRIGKLAKMLVATISSLGEEDGSFHEFYGHDTGKGSDDMEMAATNGLGVDEIDGGSELVALPQPEKRVRWMEQKMHEQLRELSELTIRKADEATLEAARKKLRQYELLRFKEFRKTMVEKLKRSNNDTGKTPVPGSKRPSTSGGNLTTTAVHSPLTAKTSNSRNLEDEGRGRRDDVVNMHIDVQVNIESGACTLRTSSREHPAVGDRTTTTINEKLMAKRPSAKDLRAKNILGPTGGYTKFSIPSVDVKGYYVSGEPRPNLVQQPDGSYRNRSSSSDSPRDGKTSNRGCFYLSIALASMPSETVVTPHLADFLEQVLEPLPLVADTRSVISAASTAVPVDTDSGEAMNNIVAIDTSVLPLDVIFHLSVQSSTIRFEGQMQKSNAADCLLKLPSLTLMGSTRRTDGSEYPGGIDISATLSAFSLSIYSPHQERTAHDALSLTLDHLSFVISRSKNSSSESENRVRFVLTANIGTANFNYDMRRLSELLAFPKPWFRKAIARRVFFGDQTGNLKTPEAAGSKQSTIGHPPNQKNLRHGVIESRLEKPWSATVFLAIQWKELNVAAKMSTTMGTTSWITRKGLLRSLTKLNSRHERDLTLTFKLDGSELTAHSGAIGGEIGLNQLALSLHHQRKERQPPRNTATCQLGSLQTRIEWMSRPIFIGRCIGVRLHLGDDFPETRRGDGSLSKLEVLLNIKAGWEDLQVVITRTTVDDFEKVVGKLKTFFTEQLKHSKNAFKFDDEFIAPAPNKSTLYEEEEVEESSSKIAHWDRVLEYVTQLQLPNVKILPFPSETVVGGSVELEGGRFSLVCMAGEMTASSWALINLRKLSIVFCPEAKTYSIDEETYKYGTSCRQRLSLRIGEVPVDGKATKSEDDDFYNMANICRVKQAKGSTMRQNASIASCLDYLIGDVLKESKLSPLPSTPSGPGKKIAHELLILFALPSFDAALTTVQNMDCTTEEEDPNPTVQSAFTAEFFGAVHLNTDFNAQVHFLPDLYMGYARASQNTTSLSTANASLPSAPQTADELVEKKDNRRYECDTWHAEPKIKFFEKGHTWSPPLVDDILKKLKVYDHRRTIPKALQRFLLDALDSGLANGLHQMLRLVHRTTDEATQNWK